MGKGRVQTSPFKNDAVKGKVAVVRVVFCVLRPPPTPV